MNQAVAHSALTTCIKCGYELAGIAAEGSCPECGVSVEFSREAMESMSSHRRKSVMRGAIGIIVSLVPIGALAIGVLWAWGIYTFATAGQTKTYTEMVIGAIAIPLAISEIVALPSYLKFGTKEPGATRYSKDWLWRRLLVAAVNVQAIAFGSFIILWALYVAQGYAQWRTWIALGAFVTYGMCAVARVPFSIMLCRDIALRLKDEKTAKLARALIWQVPLAYGIGVLSAVAILIAVVLQIWLLCRIWKLVRGIGLAGGAKVAEGGASA